jgi:hypothetical protein
MRFLIALLLAPALACTVVMTARADDGDDQAPRPAPTWPPEQTWTFGVRGEAGGGVLTRVRFCFLSDGPCPNDSRDHAIVGVEAYASFGRPNSHVRWQTSLDAIGGPGSSTNFGTIVAGRLLTGFVVLSAPSSSATFLFEERHGVSYYSVEYPNASVPMLATTIGIGGRVNDIELLGQFSYDTLLLEWTASAMFSLGYAFR